MVNLKNIVLGVLVVVVIVGGCVLAARLTSRGKSEPGDFKPDLVNDVIGRVVAVTDPNNPGGLAGWLFNAGDKLTVKQLEVRADDDGRRRVVYAEVASKTNDDYFLSGILEVHYLRVAGTYHPVALGTVTLRMVVPPKRDTPPAPSKPDKQPDKPADKGQFAPAQSLPGGKQ